MTHEAYNEDRVFKAELHAHLVKEEQDVLRAEASYHRAEAGRETRRPLDIGAIR